MDSPKWNNSNIARSSAELDAELEQVFEDLENVLGKSESDLSPDQADFPQADEPDDVVLPDDFELPAAVPPAQPLPEAPVPVLPDDFERSAAGISPAADHDPFAEPAPEKIEPLELTDAPFESPYFPAPPAAEKPKAAAPAWPATVKELSPDDLAALIEGAVARGVEAALRKQGR